MKKSIIIACLALAACAGAPVENLDVNGTTNPQPKGQVSITVVNGGVRMPSDVGTKMVPCAKDEGCVVRIQ